VVRFQLLTSRKVTFLWNFVPCSLVEINRRFEDAYCLHHQVATPQNLHTSDFCGPFIRATSPKQWRNYGVEWVAKCQGPRVGGGPLRAPASELKTLKIYLLKNIIIYKYIHFVFYLMEMFRVFFINSSNRQVALSPSYIYI
jgi:hypothetical protein